MKGRRRKRKRRQRRMQMYHDSSVIHLGLFYESIFHLCHRDPQLEHSVSVLVGRGQTEMGE